MGWLNRGLQACREHPEEGQYGEINSLGDVLLGWDEIPDPIEDRDDAGEG